MQDGPRPARPKAGASTTTATAASPRSADAAMNRRAFLCGAIFGAVSMPFVVEAREAGKVPRIGFLANVRSPGTEAFQKGLRELGYVEGQNIIVEWRLAEGRLERLAALAAELVQLEVDVIVAPSDPYVEVARKATRTIPIVFAVVTDPVGRGFVESLGKPGRNITGLTNVSRALASKRLELLKEATGAVRIGVLGNPATSALTWPDTAAAAPSLGVHLEVYEARDVGELEGAFAAMRKDGVTAVIELPDAMFYAQRRRIADLSLQHRLPMMSAFRDLVQAGGLMAYGADIADLLRRSATYVHRIVQGADPANLPVEQPTKFELVINLGTARALDLTIPPSLLLRADEVIE